MTKVDYMTPKRDENPVSLAGPGWPGWAALALLSAGLLALFSRVLAKMWLGWFPLWIRTDLSFYNRLTEGESYYTHGPLILILGLLLAALLIWRTKIAVRPRPLAGWVSCSFFLAVYAFASLLDTNLLRSLAFIGLLAGLVLLFWGVDALRRLWFPIAFLAFMVPQQTWLISDANLALKLWATDWAVRIVNLLGIPAERSGAQVLLDQGKTLVVGNVCSGLRTLISLLAFGALYAYICRLRGVWRLGLFAMAGPVAIISNCARIVSIIIVAHFWDVPTATGSFHDNSGIIVLILAFLLMFGLEKLVIAVRRQLGRPVQPRPLFVNELHGEGRRQWSRLAAAVSGRSAAVLGCLGIALGGLAWWMDRPVPSAWASHMAANAVPANLHVMNKTLSSRPLEISDENLKILNTSDYLNRQYVGLDQPVDLCVIFSKDNPTSTHPPEVCLGASGGETFMAQDLDLGQVEGVGRIGCRELEIRTGGQTLYFLYTFKYGDSYTARFGKQQVAVFFKSRLGGNASGALIRVSTPVDGNLDQARTRAVELMKTALPFLHKNLK